MCSYFWINQTVLCQFFIIFTQLFRLDVVQIVVAPKLNDARYTVESSHLTTGKLYHQPIVSSSLTRQKKTLPQLSLGNRDHCRFFFCTLRIRNSSHNKKKTLQFSPQTKFSTSNYKKFATFFSAEVHSTSRQ